MNPKTFNANKWFLTHNFHPRKKLAGNFGCPLGVHPLTKTFKRLWGPNWTKLTPDILKRFVSCSLPSHSLKTQKKNTSTKKTCTNAKKCTLPQNHIYKSKKNENNTETIGVKTLHFMEIHISPTWIHPDFPPMKGLVGLLATHEMHPGGAETPCFVAPQIPHLMVEKSEGITPKHPWEAWNDWGICARVDQLLNIRGWSKSPLCHRESFGYTNPYYWVDEHPLLYANNGSLDPSISCGFISTTSPIFTRLLCEVKMKLSLTKKNTLMCMTCTWNLKPFC